jgi:hypothetical protein
LPWLKSDCFWRSRFAICCRVSDLGNRLCWSVDNIYRTRVDSSMVVSFWFLGTESHFVGCLLIRFWKVEYTMLYTFAVPLVLVKWPFLRASIASAIWPSCYIDWVVFGRGILAKVCRVCVYVYKLTNLYIWPTRLSSTLLLYSILYLLILPDTVDSAILQPLLLPSSYCSYYRMQPPKIIKQQGRPQTKKIRKNSWKRKQQKCSNCFTLGVIKGAVLISLAERMGIENMQGTEHYIQV